MTYALEIDSLSKSYSEGTRALDGVSLKVEQGDFFALLGPNGAGKSTLIGIVSSLIKKNAGTVKIFGQDIDKDFSLAKQYLGVVPQEFNFNTFEKVEDILINQAGYYGMSRAIARERANEYLKRLGLWEKRQAVSRFLSGGMKRRLMIARALMHEPKLLVLDEPTAGVDIELRRTMWQFIEDINAQGTSIILTTHYLEEAESLCRNVAIIDQGQIIAESSMSVLLSGLKKETFIFDIDRDSRDVELGEAFDWSRLDHQRISVAFTQGEALNRLFSALERQGVSVTSMRNKANRLEELFVDMVANSAKSGEVL